MKKVIIFTVLLSFNLSAFPQSYITIDTNKIAVTITSKGKIGYNQNNYLQGVGITYNSGTTLMMCGGLLVGNSSASVDDNIYGSVLGTFDDDWYTTQTVHNVTPQLGASEEVEGVFNDSLAGISKLDITVKHRAFAWDTFPYDKFIVLEYNIKNTGFNSLNTLYAGIYIDWNISTPDSGSSDRANFDTANKMSYCYPSQGGTYAAIKSLTCNNVIIHHYAFDNDGSSNGTSYSLNILNGFSSYYKYQAIKTNRNSAGVFGTGNDVSDMISAGPFMLSPGDSTIIAFALIVGDSLADIQSSAIAANQVYCPPAGLSEYNSPKVDLSIEIYPNPVTNNITIETKQKPEIEILNIEGQIIKRLKIKDNKTDIDISDFASGVYIIKVQTEKGIMTGKFIKE